MNKLPILRLRAKEGRRVRAGAPWAFSNEITLDPAAKALPPGSPVRLAEADGTVIGTGYFNPQSLIAIRLLGGPDAVIDGAFLRGRIARALALRETLFDAPYYRLVHAEGDGLPGLVIDRFGKTVVLQVTTAGMERLTEDVIAAVNSLLEPETIVLRNDSPSRSLEGLGTEVRVVKGSDARIRIEENGASYFADPAVGQKSGWYYDQRDNRAFMAGLVPGKRVLDAYCYSGGFAVLAAKRGATEVLGLDSSEPALELARAAADANGIANICRFRKVDVFAELEKLAQQKPRFDAVICDPPPFVRSRKDLEPGAKAYRKLARLAAGLVAPGGFLFLASCSHNIPRDRFALECAAGLVRAGRQGTIIREAGAGPDHPVHPLLPETAYLKALVYALD